VASVRLAEGSAASFDILPAVWLASVISVIVGITAAKLMAGLWKN
jgi:spore maturation protein A